MKTNSLLLFLAFLPIIASGQILDLRKNVITRNIRSQIIELDSAMHKDRYAYFYDSLLKKLRPKYKIEAITPYYKNSAKEVIWEGKTVELDGQKMEMSIPISLINDKKASLFYTIHYRETPRSTESNTVSGGAGMSSDTEELKALEPFKFRVESIPGNATLYYIDAASWAYDNSILKQVFKEQEKILDLTKHNDADQIMSLLNNYIHNMGTQTPADIYVLDTNYMLFVKWGDKIKLTKMVPNRTVKAMNNKIVRQ
ncbi:MAG: hypothetical protein EOO43_25475 [Flavobacterium sp.]|nr:MAG: hypothetical protein EOO43_25475 [Flavobacterium sp.]